MAKLTIPYSSYVKVRDHLLSDGSEHLAFFLCKVGWSEDLPIFLAREAILVPDANLRQTSRSCLQFGLDRLLEIINRAVWGKMALVEAHSHPISRVPFFSAFDEAGFMEFVPYVLDSLKGLPYAATVWGKQSVVGVAWPSWPERQPLEITVVGQQIMKPSVSFALRAGEVERYDRQIRAFGEQTQVAVSKLRIGIVGLGGIGSHIAQQLAYLGGRDFILVDDQTIEDTNLNRLVGATPEDIGKSKVDVIAAGIKSIAPEANVRPLDADVRTPKGFKLLKESDVIFGCVDNDGVRLILNELCVAYLIPFIDCGTEIGVKGSAVDEVGGRVNVVLPGRLCLYCMGQIDVEEARVILATPDEIQKAKQLGYITGEPEPSPSVVSLNGLVASAAVTELLTQVSGIRAPCDFLTYDVLGSGRNRNSQWLTPQRVTQVDCFECSLSGIGDEVNLERYLKN